MPDKHIRRSPADYAEAFANDLPTGPAWPRDTDSVLMQVVTGLMQIWGDVDGRAGDMLERESDPRATIEMLEDWERNFGLPDECLDEPITIGDRQAMLVQRMTMSADPTPAEYVRIAAEIGYDILVLEHSPFMAGIGRAGDTRPTGSPDEWFRWEVGPETMRPIWTVVVKNTPMRWFRAASGQAGIDHHLEIGMATDLECILRRFKPGHTNIYFDYSGLVLNGSLAGTP